MTRLLARLPVVGTLCAALLVIGTASPVFAAAGPCDSPEAQAAIAGGRTPLSALKQGAGQKVFAFSAGNPVPFELTGPLSKGLIYCAKVLPDGRSATVITAEPGPGDPPKTVNLLIQLPQVGKLEALRWETQLVVAGFHSKADGTLDLDNPAVVGRAPVVLSNVIGCAVVALLAVILAYALAVLALGRLNGKFSIDPVVLTAGAYGKASLSQLQLFGFTLLIIWVLTLLLLRQGALSDISSDLLLLLGVSAAGTGGAKVTGVIKRRLSFDNWSWLRSNGWLTTYEQGASVPRAASLSKWADLLMTNGEFDVYSFQLATASLVVAGGILMSDLSALATLAVPQHLLALLGLSNVVYVGGKAVGPNSVGELDDQMDKLRDAESDWITAVTPNVVGAAGQPAKLTAAKAAAPDKYGKYLTGAREAARMLQAIYGTGGTKFTSFTIADDSLMPQFP